MQLMTIGRVSVVRTVDSDVGTCDLSLVLGILHVFRHCICNHTYLQTWTGNKYCVLK